MTDRRKVCNRSCYLVFRIKLLTDAIKYTQRTAQKYKSNLKWLTISIVAASNEFDMFYRGTKIINNWFTARQQKTINIETYNIYIVH